MSTDRNKQDFPSAKENCPYVKRTAPSFFRLARRHKIRII